MTDRIVTKEELAQHNKAGDAWIVISGDVYNVSTFAALHPGGEGVLNDYAGLDATDAFYGLHRHEVLEKYGPRLIVGRLEGAPEPNDFSRIKNFGEISEVPYAEKLFWRGYESPYYNESHRRFRADLRKFIHEEIREEAEAGEAADKPPSKEIMKTMAASGLLAARIGPGPHLNFVPQLPGGVKPEEFDYFHEAIAHEEVTRLACPGWIDGTASGMCIGLPPVLQFGPDWMKEKIGREVLNGDKRICLAITEAFAGSDVASIKTKAVKTPDGKHYIVNGTKKWITQGCESDYFVTAVRTGGDGMGGVSLLLIERSEGLETKRIKTSYSSAAGTSYITFEDVKVPVENILGMENAGFLCIMYNFNHERWMIIAYIIQAMRGVIEECFKWTNQRMAFGKPLINQPVIRQKLAKMVSELEAVSAWFEALTYQMNKLSYDEQSAKLAGQMSLLKFRATRVAEMIGDEAVQIFGGRGITKSGMGKMIERFQRTYKFASILGGSEEIMADLGIKMAAKEMPKNARL